MKIHCPQLKHFLSKAVLQRIQEWSDKMPAPKFVFFLKLWVVNENKEKEINGASCKQQNLTFAKKNTS